MKVVMLEPGKFARTVELGEDLEAMQNAVGGTIQAIYPFEDEVALVCNDDGKCFGLPANRALYMDGEMVDIICGSAFICAAPSDSDSFQSLSDEQIKTYTDKFKKPERFFKIGDAITAVPYNPERDAR